MTAAATIAGDLLAELPPGEPSTPRTVHAAVALLPEAAASAPLPREFCVEAGGEEQQVGSGYVTPDAPIPFIVPGAPRVKGLRMLSPRALSQAAALQPAAARLQGWVQPIGTQIVSSAPMPPPTPNSMLLQRACPVGCKRDHCEVDCAGRLDLPCGPLPSGDETRLISQVPLCSAAEVITPQLSCGSSCAPRTRTPRRLVLVSQRQVPPAVSAPVGLAAVPAAPALVRAPAQLRKAARRY